MNIRPLYICSAGVLLFSAGCQSTPPPVQQLHVYSIPEGAMAALPNGQTCSTPCVLSVQGAHIEPVTFSKPGCLTVMQMSIPEIIDLKASAADAQNYALLPNPLTPEMICR